MYISKHVPNHRFLVA